MEKTLFEERVSYFIQKRQNRKDTINAMLQMQLVSINSEEKKLVIKFTVSTWELNPYQTLHGGIISAMADVAMGCVCYASSNAAATPTLQMSVSFIKAIKEGDEVLVEAICDHAGSRIAQARAFVSLIKDSSCYVNAHGSYAINLKQNKE